MPSTYTTNNGIELIATGEQSGTWGSTTNTNLELLDASLDGQVTVTLAATGTSGSPNTLPISDGSASNGRNRLVIFNDGSDLGGTAYVQLTPNDAEKIVYVRNSLSGSRSILLFQGTYNASNDYEVPAGTTAVVFFDGAGTGAVAANVFNNAYFDSLRLGSVSVTAILDEDNMASDSATALATQQSIKAYVDTQVGANNELSEVLANGNTSGGTNIQMTTTDELQFRDTALKISSSADGQLDIDADVEVEIVAPTLDIDASTTVTVNTTTMTITGAVDVTGDLDVDNINVNGNTISSTDTNGNIALTPNGTGEVDISKVDIDGGAIDGVTIGTNSAVTDLRVDNIKVDGNTISSTDTNGDVNISPNGTGTVVINTDLDVDNININGNAITSTDTNGNIALTPNGTGEVDISKVDIASGEIDGTTIGANSAAAITGTTITGTSFVTSGDMTFGDSDKAIFGAGSDLQIYHDGTNSYIRDDGTGVLLLQSNQMNVQSPTGEQTAQFNENSDVKLYFDNAQKFATTSTGVDITGTLTSDGLTVDAQDAINVNGFQPFITLKDSNDANKGFRLQTASGNTLFSVDATGGGTFTERMRITSGGDVGIGTSSPSGKLHVQTAHTSTDVTQANSNETLVLGNSGVGDGVYNALRFGGNQQDMYIMSFNNSTEANRRLGFFVGSVAGDAVSDERLSIMGSGNVGIGTSSPEAGYKLDVAGWGTFTHPSGDCVLKIQTGNTTGGSFLYFADTADTDVGVIGYIHSTDYMYFRTNAAERMRIDSAGSLRLGTTGTEGITNRLTVKYSGAGTEYGMVMRPAADNTVPIYFMNASGGNVGSVGITASATSYNTSSDYRLKEDMQPMVGASDRVLALNPVNFAWKVDGTRVDGFLAHEAQEVVPEAVTGEKDGEEMQAIDHSKLVPLLTAALQEALTKIEALEARLNALEGQ